MDDSPNAALYVPLEDLEDWDHPVRSRAPTRPLRVVTVEPPAVSRTRTEDLDVRVMLDDGLWHREMTDYATACDLEIPTRVVDRKARRYEGPFCTRPGCWSQAELVRVQAENEVTAEESREPFRHSQPRVDVYEAQARHRQRVEERIEEIKNRKAP